MVPGVENAVILADQLFPAVLADLAELVIGIGDRPLEVGDGDDGVLVEGELLEEELALHLLGRVCERGNTSLKLALFTHTGAPQLPAAGVEAASRRNELH